MGCDEAWQNLWNYGAPQLSRQSLLLRTKLIWPRQKSISSRQNHFHTKQNTFHHGKIVSIHGKTILANFPLDISSQSTMGVNQTWWSSSWFHDSTCIAQTVEIVCLQRHISACSLDKVNRS